ncbi:MAG TPA: class I SAM-dependent methyltransferase [Pyrinomonadaceae bacterium]|jgi:hypothetical protein
MLKSKLITGRIYLSMWTVKALNACGLEVASRKDYYSVLPSKSGLEQNMPRWFKPSSLSGINYDLDAMKELFLRLSSLYMREYEELPGYDENRKKGYGPGYTAVDAMMLYFMLRDLKPARYTEVGSGLSTYYCSLAAARNKAEGHPLEITCIEPFPYEALRTIPGIRIIQKEVQDVPLSEFENLESGDLLFIDSSHVIKIDGDVPYLYLEVLPRLKKGVFIHIHDIPFPYNIPYPPQLWIFGQQWPSYWNEAMLLQAFLCFNDAYKIIMSAPLLRHFDEEFLSTNIPGYQPLSENPNTFSSIWIEKVR